MKKILLSTIAFCAIAISAHAALWRVNNTTGVNANYTTVSAAITAATAGDTIYIEPSATNYGSITLDKKLTIIGNGYFKTTGLYTMNAGLQNTMQSSVVTTVSFAPGSEFSTIMGLELTGEVYIYVSNTNVKRCYIAGYIRLNNYQSGSYVNVSNIDIRQNVMIQGLITYQFSTNSGAVGITNVNVQNNIISAYYYNQVSLPAGVSGFMMNNTFYCPYYGIDVYNFQINNNILLGGTFNTNNNVYFNNISNSTQFGTANNNQQNITTAALFNNYGTGDADSSFILKNPGPGIGTGFGSVDIGPYGGPDPYRKSGIPPVPTIYQLSAPATTTTSTLPVTISTRSND